MSKVDSKIIVDVPGLPDSTRAGYAQCVRAGDFVFVSGQTGVDEHYRVISKEFGAQARRAFHNIEMALSSAGADLSDITMMTVWLTDMRYKDEFTSLRRELLSGSLATSALVETPHLAFPDLYVEIQVVAFRPVE